MDTKSIAERLDCALADEVKRTILREAVERYNNALMDDDERQELLARIKRLRKALAL